MNPTNGSELSISPEEIQQGYENAFMMFKQVYPKVTDTMLVDFRSVTRIEYYPKNAVLIREGEICRKLFILIKGYVIINLTIDGTERPLWFIDAGQITLAVKSYLRQVYSTEVQVAIEDTYCIVLDRDQYQYLYDKHADFQKLKELLFEEYYYEALFRIELFYLAPEARYLLLLKLRPDIIMKARISDLAKYLKIARETLSRKRAELMKERK